MISDKGKRDVKFNILVIDDEKNIREGLAMALEDEGYNVLQAEDGKQGLERALYDDVDLIVTDLRLPYLSGEEILKKVVREMPSIPVIVLTGHGSVEAAVEAMRVGAYDFLTKPLDLERLFRLITRALENRSLTLQKKELESALKQNTDLEHIVGKSVALQKVFNEVRKVAPTRASVLITGESGVGKELVANAIHSLSNRSGAPFVKVHCAALAESLLESELFGHEKGAFTGALERKKGRFELANKGSIFLDEIGEINQNIQIKLLRVLQEREIERVGATMPIEVDVRVIAATNRVLETEMREGRFREDLYYRLNVVHIFVPPLRERREDIPVLVDHFIKEAEKDNGKRITSIESKARVAIYNYAWPGNIRELKNCIESATLMSDDDVLHFDDLPVFVKEESEETFIKIPLGTSMEDAEKTIMMETLRSFCGNKQKTAMVLGIGRRTLYRKMQEWGLE